MHLFRSSKRSKDARSVSPAPSPRSTQTPTASAARFRRRQPDTILPLHGTPPTLAWKKQGNNSNFLYGGQFYPEGRRRRKIRRDYPLWQQIFCSSPTRMLITLLVLTYVSLLYVVWPLLHFLMQQLSSHGSTIVRGRDLLLHHSYSSESLAHIDALYDAIQRIPPPPSLTTRSEFLQQIERPIRSLLAPDHRRPHCPTPQSDTLQQVTLVIQTTIHRLPVVQETCRRWKSSPMIVVVALSEDDEDFSSIIDSYDCPNTQWISYHLPSSTLDYPVNHLRNLALEAVSTSHVLVVDADFVPSIALEQAIVQNLPALSPRQAMVIPAFERIMECNHQNDCLELLQHNSSFIPRTMMELETCMQAHDCRVFQANNNPEGHSSTRSHEWLYDPHKELRTIECFDSLRYEPYLVLPWCANDAVPYYDERFHGYGKNKIQHVQHVRFLGFSFAVLPPQGFLVHAPHPESAVKEEWNNVKTSSLHRDMDALYREFLHELVEESRTNMVDVHSIVGPCESS